LFVGRRCIGLRGRQAGVALLKIRLVLLRLFDRSASLACQLPIAVGLLVRESQRRLRLHYLLVGLVDFRLLRCDLRSQIVDAAATWALICTVRLSMNASSVDS